MKLNDITIKHNIKPTYLASSLALTASDLPAFALVVLLPAGDPATPGLAFLDFAFDAGVAFFSGAWVEPHYKAASE